MGLGVVSVKVWIPEKWWWEIKRFCGNACRVKFLEELAEAKTRGKAVANLYRQPP